MAKQVNLYEAKARLSRLVDEAAGGAETVIAKNGRPVAALVPLDRIERKPRELGFLEGQIWIVEDFASPLPEETLRAFEGE